MTPKPSLSPAALLADTELAALCPAWLEARGGTVPPVPSNKSLFSLVNLLIVLASLMIISGVGWWAAIVLVAIDFVGRCIVFYALSLGTLAAANWWLTGSNQSYVAFTGALALGLTYLYSRSGEFEERRAAQQTGLRAAELALAWSALAVWFRSRMVGVLAVMAVEVALGYRMDVFLGTYVFGFADEAHVYAGVAGSWGLLVAYSVFKLELVGATAVSAVFHHVFEPGVLHVAAFVYYLGLLILGIYNPRTDGKRALHHGAAALLVGSALGGFVLERFAPAFGTLRTYGVTFLVFYLLSKWVELTLTKSWALCTIGLGSFLYGVSLFLQNRLEA